METEVDTGLTRAVPVAELHEAIRAHYDGLIELYEQLWGEHIHHGYWDPDRPDTDRHEAQVRTVRELAAFAGVPRGARVLDSGCGVGASAVLLAGELECDVDGITLSAEQVRRAGEKAAEAGVTDRTRFRLADALATDYPDGSFDVVWALESLELMPDKEAFFAECRRLLRPGGRLAVATWCLRDASPTQSEVRLLRRIFRDFAVSHVLPLDRYEAICAAAGFTEVAGADWTEQVRPTWRISSDLVKPFVRDPTFIWRLVRAKGVDTFRFMNSVPLMKQAYDRGLMRYGVLRGVRPH